MKEPCKCDSQFPGGSFFFLNLSHEQKERFSLKAECRALCKGANDLPWGRAASGLLLAWEGITDFGSVPGTSPNRGCGMSMEGPERLSAHLLGMLFQGWRPGALHPSAPQSTAGCWLQETAAREGEASSEEHQEGRSVVVCGTKSLSLLSSSQSR